MSLLYQLNIYCLIVVLSYCVMSSLASVSTAKKDTSISFPRGKGDPPAFYRKCCPEDQYFDVRKDQLKCKKIGNQTGLINRTQRIETMLLDKGIGNVQSKNATLPECDPNSEEISGYQTSEIAKEKFDMVQNGTFILRHDDLRDAKSKLFGSENSCFDLSPNSEGKNVSTVFVRCRSNVWVTLDDLCKVRVCLPLCCGKKQVYDVDQIGDVKQDCKDPEKALPDHPAKWLNPTVINDGQKEDILKSTILNVYWKQNLSKGNNICPNKADDKFSYIDVTPGKEDLIYHHTSDGYRLRMNGDFLKPHQYCFARYEEENTSSILKVRTCKNQHWLETLHNGFGSAWCVISTLFLIMALVYEWVNSRYKLHGAIRICLLISDLIYFFILSLKPIFPRLFNTPLCTFIGLTTQFAYLSIMCWVSVLAFDIWKTFAKFERKKDNLNKRKRLGFFNEKFKFYALFAGSIPVLVTSLTVILMFLPDVGPSVGESYCGFNRTRDLAFYFLLPSGLVLFLALFFCSLFTWNYCFGTWKQTKKDIVSVRTKKQKVKIVVRVFILMGALWLIDVISAFLEVSYGSLNDVTLTYASMFDWISYLNGFWLFLAVTVHTPCIKKVKKLLIQKDQTAGPTELGTLFGTTVQQKHSVVLLN